MAPLKPTFTTLLIKVLNELLSAADDEESLVFVPLHLGDTFDTVDHHIHLKRLELWVVFTVQWFYLYVVIYGNSISQ